MVRGKALVLFGVMVAVAWAGCVDAPERDDENKEWTQDHPLLSQPIHMGVIKEHIQVPSFDGKMMDNWVFRPETPPDATVPVFINFSPYWTNLAPSAESGGDAFSQYMIDYFVPRGYAIVLSSARGTGYSEGCFNLGGEVEQQDSFEVIEYFANLPWSNGNVGAGGKSYDGTIPNGVAVLAPPGLKTIIPVSPISELYKYNYKDGLSYTHGWRFNQYYYAGVGMDDYGEKKTEDPGLLVDDANCPYLPEMQAWGLASGLVGDSSDYWEERNYTRAAADAKASMWLIHGLQDWNVKPDNVLPWMNEYGGPVKAWLHQWVDPPEGEPGSTGHVYPMREDWNLTMLRWLDYWLKDIETGIMDEPPIQVQDSTGAWRDEESWPPRDVEPLKLAAPGGQVTDTTGVEATLDVPNGTRIVGEVEVRLSVTSDTPHGRVIATLYDGDEMITYGGRTLRHRDGIQDPQPVVPLTPYSLVFHLHPVDHVVNGPLTIRLVSTAAPYFLSPMAAEIVVDGDSSAIVVPVKTGDPVFEDPTPLELEHCWAC